MNFRPAWMPVCTGELQRRRGYRSSQNQNHTKGTSNHLDHRESNQVQRMTSCNVIRAAAQVNVFLARRKRNMLGNLGRQVWSETHCLYCITMLVCLMTSSPKDMSWKAKHVATCTHQCLYLSGGRGSWERRWRWQPCQLRTSPGQRKGFGPGHVMHRGSLWCCRLCESKIPSVRSADLGLQYLLCRPCKHPQGEQKARSMLLNFYCSAVPADHDVEKLNWTRMVIQIYNTLYFSLHSGISSEHDRHKESMPPGRPKFAGDRHTWIVCLKGWHGHLKSIKIPLGAAATTAHAAVIPLAKLPVCVQY